LSGLLSSGPEPEQLAFTNAWIREELLPVVPMLVGSKDEI
jgi:hypothetical protein